MALSIVPVVSGLNYSAFGQSYPADQASQQPTGGKSEAKTIHAYPRVIADSRDSFTINGQTSLAVKM
jgi:hypothetical protein